MNVNGQAMNVAQVFPAHRFEDVVGAIEVILIHHQGFECEFIQMQVLHERLGPTTQPVEERIRNEGYLLHIPCKLQTSQEVSVFPGNIAQVRVPLVVLNIGLATRRVFPQFGIVEFLPGDDGFDDGYGYGRFRRLVGSSGLRMVTTD